MCAAILRILGNPEVSVQHVASKEELEWDLRKRFCHRKHLHLRRDQLTEDWTIVLAENYTKEFRKSPFKGDYRILGQQNFFYLTPSNFFMLNLFDRLRIIFFLKIDFFYIQDI